MLRHEALEAHEMLNRIRDYFSNSPNFKERNEHKGRSQTLFEMTMLDEIALVYRFVHSGETYTELGAQLQLSEKYVSILVQSGIWILALLWGSRYFHPFSCDDIRAFTPLKRREVGGQNIFLAGDCVESVVNDSGVSPIHRLLYSSKVHTHTIKLIIFVTEGGVIIDRSLVLGGGATEVAGAHHVLGSAAFQGLVDTLPPDAKLVLNSIAALE
jgi:hypothetical protein